MRQEDQRLYKEIYGIVDENISLIDFLKRIGDEDKNLDFIFIKKFGENYRCKCGKGEFSKIKGRKRYQCSGCGRQISATVNTIFEKSRTPLSDWFYLIFYSSISKKNISAIQAAKNLDLSYETAHRLMKLIRRSLFQEELDKFSGIVEIDEAFLGGGTRWSRWGSICKTRKQPLLGFLERSSGLVRVELINDRTIKTLDEVIERNVKLQTTIFTDGWAGYNSLKKRYDHDFVEHSRREYVREEVHTNSIENFWGVMKRNIRGAHTKVGYQYVQNYVDEIVWKFNHRDETNLWRFNDLIDRAMITSIENIIEPTFKKEKDA